MLPTVQDWSSSRPQPRRTSTSRRCLSAWWTSSATRCRSRWTRTPPWFPTRQKPRAWRRTPTCPATIAPVDGPCRQTHTAHVAMASRSHTPPTTSTTTIHSVSSAKLVGWQLVLWSARWRLGLFALYQHCCVGGGVGGLCVEPGWRHCNTICHHHSWLLMPLFPIGFLGFFIFFLDFL